MNIVYAMFGGALGRPGQASKPAPVSWMTTWHHLSIAATHIARGSVWGRCKVGQDLSRALCLLGTSMRCLRRGGAGPGLAYQRH